MEKIEEMARKNKILIEFYILEFPSEMQLFKMIDLESRTAKELDHIIYEIHMKLKMVEQWRMRDSLEKEVVKLGDQQERIQAFEKAIEKAFKELFDK